MKITLGIDIGLTGAVSYLDDAGKYLGLFDMPVMSNGKGKARVTQQVNPSALARLLSKLQLEDYLEHTLTAYIENVSAMPGQGVSSVFSFGHTLGTVQAVLATLNIPFFTIQPTAWKKAFNLLHTEKDAARTVAIRYYPDAPLERKKDHNRADALLIARYGWNGGQPR
jgi:crossover junction endodeoxyribonuclease RuvC